MAAIESRNLDCRRPSLLRRVRVAAGLLAGLRRHDFRTARTFVDSKFPGQPWIVRWSRFLFWSLQQMFRDIPDGTQEATFARPVSLTPIWLADGNPWAHHPWSADAEVSLPENADTVVIGAGFTGGALAYHGSKNAPADREMVMLEMDDPASGSSGRNEGLVLMGRYFAHVYRTVLPHLAPVRPDLAELERQQLARQFAAAYCDAAYKNADMIEKTIKTEGFDCDYAREGWVQAADADGQDALPASVKMAHESGFNDWISITPEEVRERSGMQVRHNAGFSVAAASFHPVKWVWSLLNVALAASNVHLFPQTKVLRVRDCGGHGDRGMIGSDATRVADHQAGCMQPSRFLTKFLTGELQRYFGPSWLHLTHEGSGTVGYTADEFPVVGLLDGQRQHLIGGIAGSGTAVSFNAARCICNRIRGLQDELDDYPPEYFSPTRLLDPEHHAWPNVRSPLNGDRCGSADELAQEPSL